MKRSECWSAVKRAGVLLVLVASGCATVETAPKTTEEIVSERAAARWKVVIAGDLEKAYSFLAPSYRATVGIDRYRARFASMTRRESAEVVKVDCKAEACSVTVKVAFVSPMHRTMGVLSTHVVESWVREDGGWWLYQKL